MRKTRPLGSVPTIRLPSLSMNHGARVGFFGIEELGAFAIGSDFIDEAGIASGDEEVAAFIESHGPDVFALGVKEELRLAVFDAVDFGVGQNGGVNAVLRIDGEGVHFEAGDFGIDAGLFAGRERVDFGGGTSGRAAGIIEDAFGILRDGPQIRNGGAIELFELRARG